MSAEDVVRELFGLWNDGRIDELDRCVAEVVDHGGRRETLEEMADWHRQDRETWADITYQIHELVSDGSKMAVRWSADATHIGPWGPVPATGKSVHWEGVHFFTVSGGRVTSIWALADRFTKAQQLGVAMTPPEAG